jgi:hypothetical protein|tara:strand:+ start:2430 stop:2642 length:213 start_codon:yes stop_codon:yes gene_type:complete
MSLATGENDDPSSCIWRDRNYRNGRCLSLDISNRLVSAVTFLLQSFAGHKVPCDRYHGVSDLPDINQKRL